MATETATESQQEVNPYLAWQGRYGIGEARRLYDERKDEGLPSTYVGISDARQGALDEIMRLAQGGATGGIYDPAINEYQKVLSGAYLDPTSNPYLEDIVQRSVNAAGAAPVSQYAAAGRFGSGAMANAMADAMTQTAENIYGANYQAERDRMTQMLGQAPMLAGGLYEDANQMGRVGMQYEADEAARLQEEMRQYMAPEMRLQTFLSQLTGNPLMGETYGSANQLGLDYGQMATGGLKMLAGLTSPGAMFGAPSGAV